MTTTPLVDISRLEKVVCNLCGADYYEVIGNISRFNLPLSTAICRRCGLIYLNPRLTKEANDKFYEEAYRKLLGQKDRPLIEFFEDQKAHARRRIHEFCLGHLSPGDRVLDIGCSTGGVLSTLKEAKSCEIYGVEPSPVHADFAAAHSGVRVFTDVFDNVELEPNYFDLVLMTQVLNHLLDPLSSLRKIHTILKPSGLVYLEVMDFVQATRVFRYRDCITVDHPYMFYVETLQALLQKAGFKILVIKADRSENRDPESRRSAPWCHVRVLAEAVTNSSVVLPDYVRTKAQIRRNRRHYFFNSLRKITTYRHYAGVIVKNVASERAVKALKRAMSL